jgi:small subunit ribosomal protein S14
MPISNVIRDRMRRLLTAVYEPKRQALRAIIHTRELPLKTRVLAQHELQRLPSYSKPTAINRRCIVGGRSRNIIKEFKLSPIEFRNQSLNGDIPGVRKSVW